MCSVGSIAGSAATSGVGSRVGILSNFLIGNNLPLIIFSLALKNNSKLF